GLCLITSTAKKPMPDIVRGPSPFMTKVIGIKRGTAGAGVGVAVLIQGIVGPEIHFGDFPIDTDVERVKPHSPVRLILKNVPGALAQGPGAARGQRHIKGSGQWGVDIYSAQRAQRLCM